MYSLSVSDLVIFGAVVEEEDFHFHVVLFVIFKGSRLVGEANERYLSCVKSKAKPTDWLLCQWTEGKLFEFPVSKI